MTQIHPAIHLFHAADTQKQRRGRQLLSVLPDFQHERFGGAATSFSKNHAHAAIVLNLVQKIRVQRYAAAGHLNRVRIGNTFVEIYTITVTIQICKIIKSVGRHQA